MSEESQVMVKNMKTLLEALYALSFANPLITAMSQLEGKHVLLAEEAYPEIFSEPKVRPYFNLFLSGDERGNLKLTSFGQALKTFREYIHGLLSNDDLVTRVNQAFDIELSNPVRDFVYSAVSATDKIGKMCLRTAARANYVNTPSEIKARFDIEISEEQLSEKTKELSELLLSQSTDRVWIPELFKPYILEATSELEGKERK